MLKLTPTIQKKVRNMQFQKGLILKYDEPFEVVKKINVVAYELKLLESLISLYPSFHVSFLKPYYKDPEPTRVQAKRASPNI